MNASDKNQQASFQGKFGSLAQNKVTLLVQDGDGACVSFGEGALGAGHCRGGWRRVLCLLQGLG